MSADLLQGRYLVRFDDICASMNWVVWDAVESLLIRNSVRPILAVVPDNRDPKLVIGPPRPDFWERVRHWQRAGYAIALHGYQHRFVNENGGLMRLTYRSEFAGLPRHEQEAKLRKGLECFAEHGIHADAWAAPAHSFDRTTVDVLAELGVMVISDGLWPWPCTDARAVTWVPQQLWRFSPKPAGIWTVCCHHNGWSLHDVAEFARDLETYASAITDMATVVREFASRRATLTDEWTAFRDWTWNHYLVPARVRFRRMAKQIGSLT